MEELEQELSLCNQAILDVSELTRKYLASDEVAHELTECVANLSLVSAIIMRKMKALEE